VIGNALGGGKRGLDFDVDSDFDFDFDFLGRMTLKTCIQRFRYFGEM